MTDATAIYNYLVNQGIIVRNRNNVQLCGNCYVSQWAKRAKISTFWLHSASIEKKSHAPLQQITRFRVII